MEKLKLNVDALTVTSFEAAIDEDTRGTVAAHAISGSAFTCRSCPTIVNTCCTPVV